MKTYPNHLNIMKASAITALCLIGYFLLMKLLNLHTVVELRFFNLLIMFFGIRYMYRNYKDHLHHNPEYLTGLAQGTAMGLLTTIMFAAFIFLYLSIDNSFVTYLQNSQNLSGQLTPGLATAWIAFEGAASGVIISFVLMQYLAGIENQPQQHSTE